MKRITSQEISLEGEIFGFLGKQIYCDKANYRTLTYTQRYVKSWIRSCGGKTTDHDNKNATCVVIGDSVTSTRLEKFSYDVKFIYTQEFFEWVKAKYPNVVIAEMEEPKSEPQKQDDKKSIWQTILKYALAVVIVIGFIYLLIAGLGLFVLLMIFMPGLAKAILKGFI